MKSEPTLHADGAGVDGLEGGSSVGLLGASAGLAGDSGISDALPGASATTVAVPALLNSLPRWVLRCHCALRGFLQSILSTPWRSGSPSTTSRCSPIWPMPLPYPEAFSRHALADGRSGSKKLVSLQVACLSWLQKV